MAEQTRPTLRRDPKSPVGLVLSGGGARGAFQVGVWEVLRRHPRGIEGEPDVISGSSAGAINGALIAAGLSPEAVMDFWLDLARRPPVVANERFFRSLSIAIARTLLREPGRGLARRGRELSIAGGLLGKHRWYTTGGLAAMVLEFLFTARFDTLSDIMDSISTPFLFDTSPIKARLARAMGAGGLGTTRVRLAINVVDAHTGGVIRIVNHRPDKRPDASSRHYRYEPTITADMVLASASIPVLFNPVTLGGREYWDGGLLVNTPMAPAVALGARRIVPVLVTPRVKGPPGPIPTFGMAVERLADSFLENAYSNDRKLLLDRNELGSRFGGEEFKVVELYRAIRPESGRTFNAGSYLFFERDALIEMYESGRRAARRWLDEGPVLDARESDG